MQLTHSAQRTKYFIIITWLELLFYHLTVKKTIFCYPEIPGLGRRQSRDSRLAKTAGIQELQALVPSAFVVCLTK